MSFAVQLISEKTDFQLVRRGVKVLDSLRLHDDKFLNKLNQYENDPDGLMQRAVEIQRKIEVSRKNGENIYDTPKGCFLDGAGGVIVPGGNLNRFIKDEYLKMLRDSGELTEIQEIAVNFVNLKI